MSITIRFACGHAATLEHPGDAVPICGCGETRVQHVTARPPRFRGACTGPHADPCVLGPAVVDLAPAGSLSLKVAKD